MVTVGTVQKSGTVSDDIRPPAVAGTFYPADPATLARTIDALLAEARPPRGEPPVAIVAPHAGYVFSGHVAADAFSQARAGRYDLVVIVGPNHTRAGFDRIAVLPGTGLRTPLGVARLEPVLAQALTRQDPDVVADADVHAAEHSIEVEVPFVQRLWPQATILAVVVGTGDPDRLDRFGRTLARTVEGRRALLVASSDLSHYPPADRARAADVATLEGITALDPARFDAAVRATERRGVAGLVTAACGQKPILAVLTAARALRATRVDVVSYANSADVAAGDPERVVGYGAVAIRTGPPGSDVSALAEPPAYARPLSTGQRRALLSLARATIERTLAIGIQPLPRDAAAGTGRRDGVFVTLRKKGALRGCVGVLQGDRPLGALVSRMAMKAAFEDRRYPPVTADEVSDLAIEVSLLSPPRPVASTDQVVAGRDGVVLEKRGARAVFLPEVATEQGWSHDVLLDRLCEKAGLSAGCWRSGATLSTFRAEAFSDERP